MFKKQLRSLLCYSRSIIHIVVCLQLVFYPTWSFSAENDSVVSQQPTSGNGGRLQKHVDNAIDYNAHAESLYDSFFGVQESSEYYKSHPLDRHSLIGQGVQSYNPKQQSIIQRAKRKGYSSEVIEQLIAEIEKENQSTDEKDKKEEKKESQVAGKSKFLNKVKAKLTNAKPYLGRIDPNQLLIEVLNSKGEVQALLNFRGEELRGRLPTKKQNDLYAGNSYITEDEAKYRFRLTYHDQVLHTFSNHIRWISAFNGYLVFMEASQVYERGRALISFIDLNYFQPALNKTQLPFFQIPAMIDTKEKRSTLLRPADINIENITSPQDSNVQRQVLRIGQSGGKQFSMTHKELELLSKVQQLLFNGEVFLVNIERYEGDITSFVKSISEVIKQSMDRVVEELPKSEHAESFRIMQDMISSGLHQRIGLGPVKDKAGIYTQWRMAEHQMDLHKAELTEDQKEIYDRFTKNLEKDVKFQELISQVGANHATKRSLFERVKGLYIYLTMPQPLGAPKILEGLGAIANSLRQGETVADRAQIFMKSLTDKVRMDNRAVRIPVALLVGAGQFAVPEMRDFYVNTFVLFGDWLSNWWDISSGTYKTVTAFLNWDRTAEAYFSEEKRDPLRVGLSALFVSTLLSFVGTHILANLWNFSKYIRTQKAREHQEKVKSVFAEWEQRVQNIFHRNLAIMEMRKAGLPMEIHLQDGSIVKGLFQVGIRWAEILKDYGNKDYSIDWTINIHDAGEVEEKGLNKARIVSFVKMTSFVDVPEVQSETQQKVDLVFQPSHNNEESVSRTFVLVEGDLSELFKKVRRKTHLVDNNNLSIELNGIKGVQDFAFGYQGGLIDGDFSEKEERFIKENLEDVYTEARNFLIRRMIRRVRNIFSKTNELVAESEDVLSETQINSVGQALVYFFSYPNWAYTFTTTAYIWNYYFLYRSFAMAPRVGIKSLWYQNYFDRIYNERHRATVINGGRTSRLGAGWDQGRNAWHKLRTGQEYLSALKEFEQQMIAVERTYLRASAEQAYHLVVSMFIDQPEKEYLKPKQYAHIDHVIQSGVTFNTGSDKTEYGLKPDPSKASYILDLSKLQKKARLFFELYQRVLFKEAMREYVKENLGLSDSDQNLSDQQIRRKVIQRLSEGKELDFSKQESLNEARNRVRVLSNQLNLRDKVLHSIQKFYRGYFQKRSVKVNVKAEKFLNPTSNIQLERFEIAKQSLKDPEAIARAARLTLTELYIDKPIELIVMALTLVGAVGDITALQVLHTEMHSEEALFHLSRLSVWAGFMSALIMDLLGGTWMKIQEDARLDVRGGFDNIPNREDVEKRFAAIRWYLKQTIGKGNELKTGYKYGWRIVLANFMGALVNIGLIWSLTLGRFDIELFAGGYLAGFLMPFFAIQYKLDQAYEMFSNFSLSKLISRGFDFNGKDKKLLYHPAIIRYKMNRSLAQRRNFNILNALFVNNIIGSVEDILSMIQSPLGSRGLVRQFTFGWTPTEYWVRMMDMAQEKGVISESFAESCRKVFTKNRLDIE